MMHNISTTTTVIQETPPELADLVDDLAEIQGGDPDMSGEQDIADTMEQADMDAEINEMDTSLGEVDASFEEGAGFGETAGETVGETVGENIGELPQSFYDTATAETKYSDFTPGEIAEGEFDGLFDSGTATMETTEAVEEFGLVDTGGSFAELSGEATSAEMEAFFGMEAGEAGATGAEAGIEMTALGVEESTEMATSGMVAMEIETSVEAGAAAATAGTTAATALAYLGPLAILVGVGVAVGMSIKMANDHAQSVAEKEEFERIQDTGFDKIQTFYNNKSKKLNAFTKLYYKWILNGNNPDWEKRGDDTQYGTGALLPTMQSKEDVNSLGYGKTLLSKTQNWLDRFTQLSQDSKKQGNYVKSIWSRDLRMRNHWENQAKSSKDYASPRQKYMDTYNKKNKTNLEAIEAEFLQPPFWSRYWNKYADKFMKQDLRLILDSQSQYKERKGKPVWIYKKPKTTPELEYHYGFEFNKGSPLINVHTGRAIKPTIDDIRRGRIQREKDVAKTGKSEIPKDAKTGKPEIPKDAKTGKPEIPEDAKTGKSEIPASTKGARGKGFPPFEGQDVPFLEEHHNNRFEPHKENTFDKEESFNMRIARHMLKLCDFSYTITDDATLKNFNQPDIEPYTTREFMGSEGGFSMTQGLLLFDETSNRIVIVYRGTDFSRMFDRPDLAVSDIIADLNTLPKDFYGVLAHFGFIQYVESSLEQVLSFLDKHYFYETERPRIFISGHSLGGAGCQLLNYYLAKEKGIENIVCYTYGSPRVFFESAGLKDVMRLLKNNYRITNKYDIIPYLPPRFSPNPISQYLHIGTEYNFDNDSVGKFDVIYKDTRTTGSMGKLIVLLTGLLVGYLISASYITAEGSYLLQHIVDFLKYVSPFYFGAQFVKDTSRIVQMIYSMYDPSYTGIVGTNMRENWSRATTRGFDAKPSYEKFKDIYRWETLSNVKRRFANSFPEQMARVNEQLSRYQGKVFNSIFDATATRRQMAGRHPRAVVRTIRNVMLENGIPQKAVANYFTNINEVLYGENYTSRVRSMFGREFADNFWTKLFPSKEALTNFFAYGSGILALIELIIWFAKREYRRFMGHRIVEYERLLEMADLRKIVVGHGVKPEADMLRDGDTVADDHRTYKKSGEEVHGKPLFKVRDESFKYIPHYNNGVLRMLPLPRSMGEAIIGLYIYDPNKEFVMARYSQVKGFVIF